jgi:GNAT superfamily N-acetyltransferase
MNIRTAKEADADSLIKFNQAMALETEGKELNPDTLRNGVIAVFMDPNKGFYVVAEDDGRIIGGLMVTFEWSDWRNSWFWWIQSVYILPEARGTGLYRKLYDFVKHRASETGGVCGFRLYVETENLHAQNVYDGVGMHRSHYLLYEEENQNRVSFEKETRLTFENQEP